MPEHELRIIRSSKTELLLYCTAGDFSWEMDPQSEESLVFALNEFRKHSDETLYPLRYVKENVTASGTLEKGTATLCPECLAPIRFTKTP